MKPATQKFQVLPEFARADCIAEKIPVWITGVIVGDNAVIRQDQWQFPVAITQSSIDSASVRQDERGILPELTNAFEHQIRGLDCILVYLFDRNNPESLEYYAD
jgi:hypothetical protein